MSLHRWSSRGERGSVHLFVCVSVSLYQCSAVWVPTFIMWRWKSLIFAIHEHKHRCFQPIRWCLTRCFACSSNITWKFSPSVCAGWLSFRCVYTENKPLVFVFSIAFRWSSLFSVHSSQIYMKLQVNTGLVFVLFSVAELFQRANSGTFDLNATES